MGTIQNPIPPGTHQNRGQPTNSNPNLVPAQGPKAPTYEEVFALFSLPLSDAAESLGVSPAVLKTVCYENGHVVWPFRKLVAGKSIEEIKKEAAREKDKQFSETNVTRKKGDSSSSSSSSSHTTQGPPSSRSVHQQNASAMNRKNSTTTTTTTAADQFKYGFPSEGLSTVSNKWWSNRDSDETKRQVDAGRREEEATTTTPASSLSSLRKRVAAESKEALKHGVYRGYYNNVKTPLDETKRSILHMIFGSTLPAEWEELDATTTSS